MDQWNSRSFFSDSVLSERRPGNEKDRKFYPLLMERIKVGLGVRRSYTHLCQRSLLGRTASHILFPGHKWDRGNGICHTMGQNLQEANQCHPSGTQGRHLNNTTDLAHSGLELNYNPPVVGRGGFPGSKATTPPGHYLFCQVDS